VVLRPSKPVPRLVMYTECLFVVYILIILISNLFIVTNQSADIKNIAIIYPFLSSILLPLILHIIVKRSFAMLPMNSFPLDKIALYPIIFGIFRLCRYGIIQYYNWNPGLDPTYSTFLTNIASSLNNVALGFEGICKIFHEGLFMLLFLRLLRTQGSLSHTKISGDAVSNLTIQLIFYILELLLLLFNVIEGFYLFYAAPAVKQIAPGLDMIVSAMILIDISEFGITFNDIFSMNASPSANTAHKSDNNVPINIDNNV